MSNTYSNQNQSTVGPGSYEVKSLFTPKQDPVSEHILHRANYYKINYPIKRINEQSNNSYQKSNLFTTETLQAPLKYPISPQLNCTIGKTSRDDNYQQMWLKDAGSFSDKSNFPAPNQYMLSQSAELQLQKKICKNGITFPKTMRDCYLEQERNMKHAAQNNQSERLVHVIKAFKKVSKTNQPQQINSTYRDLNINNLSFINKKLDNGVPASSYYQCSTVDRFGKKNLHCYRLQQQDKYKDTHIQLQSMKRQHRLVNKLYYDVK